MVRLPLVRFMKLGLCDTGPLPGGEPGSSKVTEQTFDVDFTEIST